MNMRYFKNLPNILRLIKITQQSIGNGIKLKKNSD